MNFDLHLYGETPEELLNVLAHLGHMDSNYHTPIPDERHPAQAPASQADAAPVTSTSAPESEPAAEPDPVTLDKIRDLARSLIVAGKRAGVQAAIKATGAASVSKLPPDSYTNVWEELLKLKDEVDANASN